MRKRRGFWAVVLLPIALGCGQSVPLPIRPLEGVTVAVACPNPAVEGLIAAYSKSWSQKTGARVRAVHHDRGVGVDTSIPAADGWVLTPADIGPLASAGQLTPFREGLLNLETSYGWLQILPVYRNKQLLWGNRTCALPLLGSAPLCFFRSDLLEDPGHRERFKAKFGRPLAPPATWDEYADIAAYFQGQEKTLAASASLPPLPSGDEGMDFEFTLVAAPLARRAARENQVPPPGDEALFSFLYDVNTTEPLVAGPAFVEALRLLQRLQAYRPHGASAEPAASFASGHAVLCLAGAEWLARFQEEGAPARGRVGVCRVPGSRRVFDFHSGKPQVLADVNYLPCLGFNGWVAVVPRSSAAPAAAFELLQELSSPQTSGEILFDPAWAGGAFRRDHFNLLQAGDPFGQGAERQLAWVEALRQTLTPAAVNPVLPLRTPDRQEHIHALAAELRSALLEAKDPKQTMQAVSDSWRQLDQKKSVETRRTEYRLSVNLKATN